jgi:hypothetical protein
MDDVRLAFRWLRTRPATTLASIATLACAIGAAAVTWSALSAVLINPLPIADPARLIVVGSRYEGGREAASVSTGFDYPKFHQIAKAACSSRRPRGDGEPRRRAPRQRVDLAQVLRTE